MAATLVFTLIGPDRPGLVERVATCVAEHGGNWEEGKLLGLDGHFAGVLRVGVPPGAVARLAAALRSLEGLTVTVAEAIDYAPLEHRVLVLEVVGSDHPGIVQSIGRALAMLGVNVAELETWTERAAMSGEPVFRAHARLEVPAAVGEPQLRASLEQIAHDLMVELHVGQAP